MTTAAAVVDRARHIGLQIMFGVGGEHDLTERDAAAPRGLAGQPARSGSATAPGTSGRSTSTASCSARPHRLADQLDAHRRGHPAVPGRLRGHRRRALDEKDQGIWEVRGDPQHFLYSKVMCWVALDRAIALADLLRRVGPGRRAGSSDRDEIRRDRPPRRLERAGAGAFTQYVGSTDLDASNLMMAIVGFLPADDPRMLATIDAIEDRLTDDRGLVYRYRTEGGVDGLAGEEGTFLLCTFWLAQALAMAGQVDRARAVFERAAAFVNDVGLLAEEVDPATGELLGNFPQAFSHIGLVNAAWAISEAERRAPS